MSIPIETPLASANDSSVLRTKSSAIDHNLEEFISVLGKSQKHNGYNSIPIEELFAKLFFNRWSAEKNYMHSFILRKNESIAF